MFASRVPSIVVCLALLLGLPWEAFAQTPRPERPYRGLFGSGSGDAPESLVANASIGAGYDDNLLLDQPGLAGGVDPRTARSGNLGLLNTSLAYTNNKDRVNVGAQAGASTRYYGRNDQSFVGAYGAGVGTAFRYGTRSSLSLNQSVSFQPYTFTSLFPALFEPVPGQFESPALDLATGSQAYLSLDSNVGLNHAMSQRVNFYADYGFSKSETAFRPTNADGTTLLFSRHTARGGFLFNVSRGLGVRLGYGYTDGSYSGSSTRGRTHNVDAGIDYSKALSFSRRTTLSFTTGTAALTDGRVTSYQAVGNAHLAHEIGRSWLASVAYDRSFRFVDTLLLPVFYDSVNIALGGLVSRRVEVQTGLRGVIGTIGYGGDDATSDFDTFQALAGVSFALNRFMQIGTSYSFYRYRFDRNALLPVGVARNIDRQSIRAQLNFWAPLMTRRR